MMVRLGVVALLVWLGGTVGAAAGQHNNAAGKFSVWIPDIWVVTETGNRITARNPKDTIELVVSPLKDADADLVDEDVADFVDDEIDNMKVVSDTPTKQAGLNARMLQGTGTDEGDDIVFRAVAIDPGGSGAVIEVVVYGDDDLMDDERIKEIVTHILKSLKPT